MFLFYQQYDKFYSNIYSKDDYKESIKFQIKNKLSKPKIAFLYTPNWKVSQFIYTSNYFAPDEYLFNIDLPTTNYWIDYYKDTLTYKNHDYYDFSNKMLKTHEFQTTYNKKLSLAQNQSNFIKSKNIKTLIIYESNYLDPLIKKEIIDSVKLKDAKIIIYQLK